MDSGSVGIDILEGCEGHEVALRSPLHVYPRFIA